MRYQPADKHHAEQSERKMEKFLTLFSSFPLTEVYRPIFNRGRRALPPPLSCQCWGLIFKKYEYYFYEDKMRFSIQ